MTLFNCETRHDCTGIAIISSLIIGVLAAFLQITGVITLTPILSIVAFSIAILYLAVTLITTALSQRTSTCHNSCSPLTAVLFGILGTILFAVILLVITFAATSIIGAIIIGALFFSFSLMIIATTCLAKCYTHCGN